MLLERRPKFSSVLPVLKKKVGFRVMASTYMCVSVF